MPQAPLPELHATPPDWARAEAAARELGLNALAKRHRRARGKPLMEVVSHPASRGCTRPAATPSRRRGSSSCTSGSRRSRVRAGEPRRTSSAATRRRCSSGCARRRGWLDADTPCTATTYEAALLAAGAAIEAVRRGGFALARPPGHHAEPGRAMGFCIFDSIALPRAGPRPSSGSGGSRSSTGTSTTETGRRRSSATTRRSSSPRSTSGRSIPGTGGPAEQGETLLNLPLAAGTGDEGFLAAFERAEAAIAAFEPELLLVSAGFDAHAADPLAQLELSAGIFEELARRARALAPRVAAVLEGGYNLDTLPDLVAAALRASAQRPEPRVRA